MAMSPFLGVQLTAAMLTFGMSVTLVLVSKAFGRFMLMLGSKCLGRFTDYSRRSLKGTHDIGNIKAHSIHRTLIVARTTRMEDQGR